MRKKTDSLISTLHAMIQAMSKREKQIFSQEVADPENSHYYKVFDAFSRSKGDVADKLCLIYFEGDRSAFLSSCRYLAGKILDQMAKKKGEGKVEIEKIKLAIGYGFFKLARTMITKGMHCSFKRADLDSLLQLYEQVHFLKVHHGLEIRVDDLVPSHESVLREFYTLASSKLAYKELHPSRSRNYQLLSKACTKWGPFLNVEAMEFMFRRTEYQFRKARVRYFILKREFQNGLMEQARILEIIEDSDLLPPEQVLVEHRIMVFSHINAEDENAAVKSLFELGMLDTPFSEGEDRIILEWVKCTLYFCAVFHRPDLEKKAISEFEKIKSSYPSRWKAILYYWMSIIELSNENWAEVKDLQNKILSLPSDSKAGIELISPIIKAICCLEMGETTDSKLVLDRYRERLRQTDSRYLAMCMDLLTGLSNPNISEQEKQDVYAQAIRQLSMVSTNPDEMDIVSLFSIQPWLKSKSERTPLAEFLKANPCEKWITPNLQAS